MKTLGLVVEIDGASHDFKEEYDFERTKYLESLGLKVFKISDWDVKQNLPLAMKDLENYIIQHYSS